MRPVRHALERRFGRRADAERARATRLYWLGTPASRWARSRARLARLELRALRWLFRRRLR